MKHVGLNQEGFELSERHQMLLLLRVTTRVCHVKRILQLGRGGIAPRTG